jgi:hypothetical protein
VELQGYIEKLSALPKEYFVVSKQFADDPQALRALNANITEQRIFYARRAAELVDRIPNEVSSTENNFVAEALFQDAMYSQGNRLVRMAIDRSKDYNDAVASYRNAGVSLIFQGKLKEGRDSLQSALEIFAGGKYVENSEDTKNLIHFETELNWAQAEFAVRETVEGSKHLVSAQSFLEKLPAGAPKNFAQANLTALQTSLNSPGTIQPNAPPLGVQLSHN